VITNSQREGQGILDNHRVSADVGLAANPTELMYPGIGADVGAVCDEYVAGEGGGIGHNYVIANQTVVRHMGLGHEETIVTDSGNATTTGSSPMHSDKFANARSPPDFCFRMFTRELQILRWQSDRNKREEMRFVTDARTSVDNAVTIDSDSVSENYLFADYGVRSDGTINANLGT